MNRPLVVFSHANGFPSGTYRKFLEDFAPHFEVRAPDMLGHDPRFRVDDNWGNLARELLAWIDVHCDRPVIGVGHSMGAMVTFMAAHLAPEKFRAVVMLDPPIINGWPAVFFQLMKWMGRADEFTPAGRSRNRRSNWPSPEDALADLSRKRLFAAFDPECLRDYVGSVLEPHEGAFRLRYRVEQELAIFRTTPSNPWRFVRRLRVPGVVIAGAQSDVAMPAHLARLGRWHGMARLTTTGGHLFPLEHPLDASRLVRQEIDALLRAGKVRAGT